MTTRSKLKRNLEFLPSNVSGEWMRIPDQNAPQNPDENAGTLSSAASKNATEEFSPSAFVEDGNTREEFSPSTFVEDGIFFSKMIEARIPRGKNGIIVNTELNILRSNEIIGLVQSPQNP